MDGTFDWTFDDFIKHAIDRSIGRYQSVSLGWCRDLVMAYIVMAATEVGKSEAICPVSHAFAGQIIIIVIIIIVIMTH